MKYSDPPEGLEMVEYSAGRALAYKHTALGSAPVLHKAGVAVHTCNPSTQEPEQRIGRLRSSLTM